ILFFIFFSQAEDGIRDFHVTGVQTCALPISAPDPPVWAGAQAASSAASPARAQARTGRERAGKEEERPEGPPSGAVVGDRIGSPSPVGGRGRGGDRCGRDEHDEWSIPDRTAWWGLNVRSPPGPAEDRVCKVVHRTTAGPQCSTSANTDAHRVTRWGARTQWKGPPRAGTALSAGSGGRPRRRTPRPCRSARCTGC